MCVYVLCVRDAATMNRSLHIPQCVVRTAVVGPQEPRGARFGRVYACALVCVGDHSRGSCAADCVPSALESVWLDDDSTVDALCVCVCVCVCVCARAINHNGRECVTPSPPVPGCVRQRANKAPIVGGVCRVLCSLVYVFLVEKFESRERDRMKRELQPPPQPPRIMVKGMQ